MRENNKDECGGTDAASRGQFSSCSAGVEWGRDTAAVCAHKILSLNG